MFSKDDIQKYLYILFDEEERLNIDIVILIHKSS